MRKYIDAEDLMRRMYNRAFETDGDTMWQSGCWVRYRAIEAVVKETPAVDIPRWIPVTERLPEKVGLYPVTCLDGGRQIDLGQWCIDECGEGFWECDWCDANSVIAWMPLPNPYKEGEQNE